MVQKLTLGLKLIKKRLGLCMPNKCGYYTYRSICIYENNAEVKEVRWLLVYEV